MNERLAPAVEDARRWACAELDVSEDAPPEAIRAAFLKHVGEADFFPTPDSVIAWQTLAGAAEDSDQEQNAVGPSVAVGATVATTTNPRTVRIVGERVQNQLRAPVEQFAERFFSIEVGERVREWFELRSRCQSSASLVARLEALSPGLHIDHQASLAETPGDGSADAPGSASQAPSERLLAEKLFELFTLRPVDRAERQQEILQSWQADLKQWQGAAQRLKKRLPKIADLSTEFVVTILDRPRVPSKPARRGALAPATIPISQTISSYAPPSSANQEGRKQHVGKWTAAIVIFLSVSAISRFVQDKLHPSPPRVRQKSTSELEIEKFQRDQIVAKMKEDAEKALKEAPEAPPSIYHGIDPQHSIQEVQERMKLERDRVLRQLKPGFSPEDLSPMLPTPLPAQPKSAEPEKLF